MARSFFVFIGAGASLAMAMTLFARVSVLAEICTHFYIEYVIAIGVAMLGLLMLKLVRPAACLLPFLLIALFQTAPYYLPPKDKVPPDAPSLSVMAFNVNDANLRFGDVVKVIRDADPDVFSIEESTEPLIQHLQTSLGKEYPYDIGKGQDNPFGIALFSKYPMISARIDPLFKEYSFPTAVAEINVNGKQVTVLGVHPPPPFDQTFLKVRTDCMAKYDGIIHASAGSPGRYVIMGDMNCGPWSPYMRDFMSKLQLHDTALGFGLQPTWPSYMPIISAPIDHILVGKSFQTLVRARGPSVGSDHFPIYAKLAIVD